MAIGLCGRCRAAGTERLLLSCWCGGVVSVHVGGMQVSLRKK